MELKKLSSLQKSIVLSQKMRPQNSSYNLPYLWKFSGDIDLDKLYCSIEKIFNIHDIYKSNVIDDKFYFDFERHFYPKIYRINSVNNIDFYKKVKMQVENYANKPIDVNKWPLQKAFIYTSPDIKKECYLFLNISHIVCDVYSAYQLISEICNEYNDKDNKNQKISQYLTSNNKMKESRKKDAVSYFYNKFQNISSLKQYGLYIDYKNDRKNLNIDIDKPSLLKITKDTFKTEFDVLLSAYAILIHRLTAANTVIIGVPIANRTSKDRHTHGCFVNTLPLIIDIKERESFLSFLSRIKKELYKLMKYQSFDISKNMDLLSNNKSMGAINNAVTFCKKEINFDLKKIKSESIPLSLNSTMFAISAEIENSKNKMILHLQTSSQYDPQLISELVNNIIKAGVNTDLTIKEILSSAENIMNEKLKYLENKFNAKSLNTKGTILDDLEKNLRLYPERIAVKDSKTSFTYSELNSMSNKIANKIEIMNCDEVVVSTSANSQLIATIIGILKADKIYVPIDKYMPKDRKKLILNQLKNPLILEDYKEDIFENIVNVNINSILNDSELSESRLNKKIDNNDIAYIIFTSGSTGLPKGVKVSHKSLESLINICINKFNGKEHKNWVLFHSYGFDYSIFEIFGALATGGKLNIVPHEIRKYPDQIYKFINDNKINVLTQTPSAFLSLQRYDLNKSSSLKTLQYIFIGGEDVKFADLKPWFNKYGYSSPEIYNLYGLTEATIISTAHKINMRDVDKKSVNNIGRPLSNTKASVIDKNGRYVFPGFTGELYLSGDSISSGYYRNLDKSKKSFDSGFNTFKTGDLVKLLSNGELKYLNRIDKQVQVSGHRVELGEIENAMCNYTECNQAFVKTQDFNAGDRRLVCYYNSINKLDKFKVRKILNGKIPDYMIPSYFIKIDKFPLNISGKIDSSKLPKVITSSKDDKSKKPIKTVDKIIDQWNEILGISVGENDGFFDAGGTSVLIAEAYYRILKEFKLSENDFSMVDLFEYTTPRKVSEYVDRIIREKTK